MFSVGVCVARPSIAADLAEAERLHKSGKYAECIELSGQAIQAGDVSETWQLLRIQSQLAVGHYADAQESLKSALVKSPSSIRLRWLGREVYRFNGETAAADKATADIARLLDGAGFRYRDSLNLVTIGRFFLDQGADAKEVLDGIYDPLKKDQPRQPEAFIASGELALAKHDYGLAATAFEQAAKLDPRDPEIAFQLARAYAPSDSDKADAALKEALRLNPNHVPSLLFVVDQHVDAERYNEAGETLEKVLAINGKQPLAWAYRAVLAHLENDADAERAARNRALSTWPRNPEVDHLIGRKLSQKYRFREGAGYQRQALAFDPAYLPAKMQLSQDLLRLGDEVEGWKLAEEVFEKDGYNVVAHNLATLRDQLTKFTLLKRDGFVVRMEAKEAKIYGQRVLDLLSRAKQQLCAKYEVSLPDPIYVDIYPRQQDFAIRTFGLPGGAGFLGVCFGQVITMNSPAAQGASPSNWQSVLWHEFCHVVTLTKTHNRMPRWLSEGISVYEERQAHPAWGQSMSLEFRRMILDGELTPVSLLSGAFLRPKSADHLQFAYYESSLVVEYLIERHGLETLNHVLTDLGAGLPINEALERYVGSVQALDQDFAAYAKTKANALASQADLTDPKWPRLVNEETLAAWLKEHPNSFQGLQRYVKTLIAAEKWEQAKPPLKKLLELYPEHGGRESALVTLALVHRRLQETEQERAMLVKLADLSDEAVDVYLRLAEISAAEKDWAMAIEQAERALAVNPLIKAPHRYLAEAAEQTGDDAKAIPSLRALAEMDPVDPAELHFRLARLLKRTGDQDEARLQVLKSLEEAPRYRDAQRLLLALVEDANSPKHNPARAERSAPSPAIAEKQP